MFRKGTYLKRPMFMAALMALSGAAMSIYAKHYYAILVFILIVLIFLLMHKKYNLSYKYCIILIIFPITYFGTLEMKNKLIFENVIEAEGTYIENVTGKVISISDKQNYYVLELDSCEFSIDGTKSNKTGMLVYTDKNNILENDIITMSGKIKVLDSARNWGEFDSRNYYLSKGIQYSFKASEINIKERQESGLGEFLRYVRKNVKEIYNKTFRGDNYGLICAMVLGDKNDLEEDIKNLYSKNGISHLLAVSGLHMAVTGMLVYKLLRRIFGFLSSGIISICLILVYLNLTGNGISAKRAVIMIVLSIIADIIGRSYDLLSSLSMAAVIMIVKNGYIITNSAFLLSFLALFGIIFINPVFNNDNRLFIFINKKKINKLCRRILESLSVSLSIQMATLPVVLNVYYQIPLYGIFLNIIVIPLMSFVMIGGIITAVVGTFSLKMAVIAAGASNYILDFYNRLCLLCEKLPAGIYVTGRPDRIMLVIYCTTLLVFVIINCITESYGKSYITYLLTKNYKLICCAGLSVMIFTFLNMQYKFDNDVNITMLDVGQGDCILLSGPDNKKILFDGGSTDVKNVGKYRIYKYIRYCGIKHLDYISISHTDKDHYSGISELIDMTDNTFSIGKIYFSAIVNKNDEGYLSLVNKAEMKNIDIDFISMGECIDMGNMEVTCVYPGRDYKYTSNNDSSTVFMLKYKRFSMLMMGDAEKSAEEKLLKNNNISKATVLKTGHHGSKGASCEAFLKAVTPEIALISSGINNSYGHPHIQTLDRLDKVNAKVINTQDSGAISIGTDGENIKISQYKKD